MKKLMSLTSRILVVFVVGFYFSGCSNKGYDPVEILGIRSGMLSRDSEGKPIFSAGNEISLDNHDGLYWFISFRSNKEKIKYIEEIRMSGPTHWGFLDKKQESKRTDLDIKVSEDKTTAIVTREIDSPKGLLYGSWRFYKDEPRGPVEVKVTIEGKLTTVLNWNIK